MLRINSFEIKITLTHLSEVFRTISRMQNYASAKALSIIEMNISLHKHFQAFVTCHHTTVGVFSFHSHRRNGKNDELMSHDICAYRWYCEYMFDTISAFTLLSHHFLFSLIRCWFDCTEFSLLMLIFDGFNVLRRRQRRREKHYTFAQHNLQW